MACITAVRFSKDTFQTSTRIHTIVLLEYNQTLYPEGLCEKDRSQLGSVSVNVLYARDVMKCGDPNVTDSRNAFNS